MREEDVTPQGPGEILLGSDLKLACGRLIDYYRPRFQIEFIFRDAQ